MPGASAEQINKIVRICQDAGLKYRIFSSARNLDSLSPRLHFPIRAVELLCNILIKARLSETGRPKHNRFSVWAVEITIRVAGFVAANFKKRGTG